MRHLTDPDHKVYYLGMEGEFFEVDVQTLAVTKLAEVALVLDVPAGSNRTPQLNSHFKAGYSCFGRVVVAANSYNELDFTGQQAAGRLAEWDGKAWTIIERAPFVEVTGRGGFGGFR